MKKLTLAWLLVTLLLLAACGSGADEAPTVATDGNSGEQTDAASEDTVDQAEEAVEAPTNTPVPPTETPTPVPPTATPEPEPMEISAEVLNAAAMAVDSARYRMVMDVSGGAEEAITMEIDFVTQTDPVAFDMTMTPIGLPEEEMQGMENIRMLFVDNQFYMSLGPMGCFSGSGEEFGVDLDELQSFNEAPDFDVEDLELVERGVEVNGYTTDHYRLNIDADQFDMLAGGIMGGDDLVPDDAEVDSTVADIFIATDELLLVRYVYELTGSEDGSEVSVQLQMDLLETDVPVDITIPEACLDTGSAYPTLPDAFESATFAGISSYKTNTPLDDIIEFYQAEMSALGYAFDDAESFVTETFASLAYSADDAAVTVSVAEESAATETEPAVYSVTIIGE